MLQLVNVGHKSLADYASLATRGLMDEISRLAEPLQGTRVLQLSATAFGGGVAEIGWDLHRQYVVHADNDPDIFILSNFNNVGSVEVNAFQVHSRAVIRSTGCWVTRWTTTSSRSSPRFPSGLTGNVRRDSSLVLTTRKPGNVTGQTTRCATEGYRSTW